VVEKWDCIDDEITASPRPSPICSAAATVLGSDWRLSCRGEEARGQAASEGLLCQGTGVRGRWEKEN
jgi:hypothetical protein